MVVDSFLAQHREFELFDLRLDQPAAMTPFLDARGMFRTLPFAHGLEAFFAAAVLRAR
jgi:16S rRNA C967 or C1407 C5-methylase (RsmB/RsmF family)